MRLALALLAALAVALAAAPAAEHGRKPAAGRPDRGLVGLPVYSSDGKRIGTVLAIGVDDGNHTVLVAEIDRPLGMASAAVAIPLDMFRRQSDRIVLTITAEEAGKRASGRNR